MVDFTKVYQTLITIQFAIYSHNYLISQSKVYKRKFLSKNNHINYVFISNHQSTINIDEIDLRSSEEYFLRKCHTSMPYNVI